MKKRYILSLMLGCFIFFNHSSLVLAQTATQSLSQILTMSVAVPQATGISLAILTNDQGTPCTWPVTTCTTLNFGDLKLDPVNHVYISPTYYTIYPGLVGGAPGDPLPVLDITYQEQSNPNNPGGNSNGLGTKAEIKVVSTAGGAEKQYAFVTLANLVNHVAQMPNMPGQWEKIYLNISTGAIDGTGAKPFTASDAPGPYSGTLTFTVVSL